MDILSTLFGAGAAFLILIVAIGLIAFALKAVIFAGNVAFNFIKGILALLVLVLAGIIWPIMWILRALNFISWKSPEKKTSTEARSGTVDRVVDGDTIIVNGENIRIAYIDAPEIGQNLIDGSGDAGRIAKTAMVEFLRDCSELRVIPIDQDRYGRTVAELELGEYDVGLTFVRMGLAIALKDAPPEYHAAEQKARSKEIGLWGRSGFIRPDLHRTFNK